MYTNNLFIVRADKNSADDNNRECEDLFTFGPIDLFNEKLFY